VSPALYRNEPGSRERYGIRVVVEGVRTEHGRELPVVERKMLGITHLEPDVGDAVRELDGLADHLRGEIQADDGLRCGREVTPNS
jgi:hypothetical protein